MAVFKCKMCGGDLEITEGVSVCECEYCGTKQTVPSADSEKKITLFGRANRLRFNNEFDKAAGVYESIVADFPEEAEAYWGLVLCKYGIEYVDDPATSKKIPTCHRSSFESVMDDSNYEQTLENADALARGVYREEAKQIEELRKGIIEVSSKEEPYDIFICYKETTENGDRTIDSVIAQDVYTELTEKGYRVFFSRISLEDKLGVEYEPYIFAALNSAKIMLAFGTDYEYYNAVWVKNEWSRFLQLIAKGEKKTLIPCYKGIDAYDMPKEFAKLQAQDMGKVGAMQDLIRGIEKILSPQKETTMSRDAVKDVTADSLLERGYILLQDGEFTKANEYFDKVLDRSPKESKAYWGKLLARESCVDGKDLTSPKKADELCGQCIQNDSPVELDDDEILKRLMARLNPMYKNAITFSDGAEKTAYTSGFNNIMTAVLTKFHQERDKEELKLAEERRKTEEERKEKMREIQKRAQERKEQEEAERQRKEFEEKMQAKARKISIIIKTAAFLLIASIELLAVCYVRKTNIISYSLDESAGSFFLLHLGLLANAFISAVICRFAKIGGFSFVPAIISSLIAGYCFIYALKSLEGMVNKFLGFFFFGAIAVVVIGICIGCATMAVKEK